ncbi:hypothetical protein K474DRAFT_1668177 [Panus rudis PR-1116 ss-1]|nr:hypothetical protein K474DRAFT_1668177 [Panus rudis PR-1116 ss-1]
MGLRPEQSQAKGYLAIWRHVGYYLGISPSILSHYFTEVDVSNKLLASLVLDLFSENQPLETSPVPTMPILKAVSNRPPMGASLAYHCALTRFFAGDELADHLGVPKTARSTALKVHASMLVYKIPILFSRWYPRKAWAAKRREVFSEGLARSIRSNIGMRRTTFRPRTDVGISGDKLGGDLDSGVLECEQVVPDFVGGTMLVRKWREMLGEMLIVCIVIGARARLIAQRRNARK